MKIIDEKMKKILPFIDEEFFGDPLEDIKYKLSHKRINELNEYPKLYKDFLYKYGSGELSIIFWIDSSLKTHEKAYGRTIKNLDGILVFGSDIGEYTYAFDTKNNWEVVDIDASGEIFEIYGDFETFINKILDEIIESMDNDEED